MSRRYRRKEYNGRGLVSIISYLIRQFYFPNPFTNLFQNMNTATIVNWICGGIFITLTYILTGTWYNGGEKAIGSFGFFINYSLSLSPLIMFKFHKNCKFFRFSTIISYSSIQTIIFVHITIY